jgi:transcriptional regulator with XRE-family HTH domain
MERDFDQVRQSLAHNIRSLRSQQGLSQEALALNAEVDRTYVSQIERAVGNPSLLVLCKLAAILRVDTMDLVAPGIQPTTFPSNKTP